MRTWRIAAPGLLTVVVAGAGWIRLGGASLWLDEASSRALARAPWDAFVEVASQKEANMSLYYVLLRAWRGLFGESEVALRSLSVVAAAAAIPLLWGLASRLFGRGVALIACALMGVNGFVLHHAHQARAYTLVMTLCIASTLALVRALDAGGHALRWVVYGVVAAASVYAHFFAGFVLLAHLGVIVARRPRVRALAPGLGVMALLLLPLGAFMLGQKGAQIAWIPRTTLRTVVPTFTSLTGQGGKPLLIAYFLACAGGAIALYRRPDRWKGGMVVAWAAAPAALAFGISLAVPIVRPQYLIVTVPALCLLAAAGIAALGRRTALAAAGTLLAFAAAAVPATYRGFQSHDWRSAADYLIGNARYTDGAVFYAYYGFVPFSYYASRQKGDLLDADFPPRTWGSADLTLPKDLGPYIQTALRHSRLWLVLNNARTDTPTAELAVLLNGLRSYRRTAYREFQGGIRIGLYERTGFTPSDGSSA